VTEVIDTHAHLDALEDANGAVERARAAGVTRIVSVGTDPDSWVRTLAIAKRHDGVYAALGLHPHEADSDGAVDALRDALADPCAVALGETGLDYYRDHAPREAQRRAFEAQLDLAAELRKPAIIHTRAADADTVSMLSSFQGTTVMHCFSSAPLLEPALDRGWYVSFAGNVTYKNAYDLRAAARAIPAERLLAETDSPYLAPQPKRGKPNEPAYVLHTVAALAEARGEDADALAAQIDANANACFGLS
jgi:TatD DNase family protein